MTIVTSSNEQVGIIQIAKANLVGDPNKIRLQTEFRIYYFRSLWASAIIFYLKKAFFLELRQAINKYNN